MIVGCMFGRAKDEPGGLWGRGRESAKNRGGAPLRLPAVSCRPDLVCDDWRALPALHAERSASFKQNVGLSGARGSLCAALRATEPRCSAGRGDTCLTPRREPFSSHCASSLCLLLGGGRRTNRPLRAGMKRDNVMIRHTMLCLWQEFPGPLHVCYECMRECRPDTLTWAACVRTSSLLLDMDVSCSVSRVHLCVCLQAV